MEKLFISIFNMSISASYLILAVLAVRFLLRKAPKTMRGFLWLLVGLRLLFPFSIESAFSLIPNTQMVSERINDNMQQPLENTQTNTQNMLPEKPTVSDTIVGTSQMKINQTSGYLKICTEIWIAGMAVMAGYMFISWFRLSKRVSTAVPVEFSSTDDGAPAAKIYRSEQIDSPFLFGIIRPRIFIPSHIPAEDIPYVILHEKIHMKRKDYLIKPAGFMLLSVYWFNPLIWAAYIMLCKDIELICDELVVKRLGTECKKAYSQALLTSSVNRRMIAACPVAFGEISVKERVKNVLNYKKPAFWALIAAALACIILPICFMTQKKTDISQIAGEYVMDISSQEEYLFVPRLSLGEDNTFSLGYDVASSYLPYGHYKLKDNILTAVTDDGKYHYQFTLSADGDLIFDAEQSSDVFVRQDGMSPPLENGSVFTKDSILYTKYYTENMEDLLEESEELIKENLQNNYQGGTKTVEELEQQMLEVERLQKQIEEEEALLQKQLEELQSGREETRTILQDMSQQSQSMLEKLDEEHTVMQNLLESVRTYESASAYETIEQWARAFCDRNAEKIIDLASENLQQQLADQDLLLHGYNGEEEYAAFGWSSPWPWGADYDVNDVMSNYRIINITDQRAEILYYAWVSDPHITVWCETLTYKKEDGRYVITAESLRYMDNICTAEEFYQAYPDGVISGTMMDYFLNAAGEALNNNAKKNRDSEWYNQLFEPDTAAVYLLNLLNNQNKVETSVDFNEDNTSCVVTITFLLDKNRSVDVEMIRPYGSDGIWIPASYKKDASIDNTAWEIPQNNGVLFLPFDKKSKITIQQLLPNN